MVLNRVDPKPIQDPKPTQDPTSSTSRTAAAPPLYVAPDLQDDRDFLFDQDPLSNARISSSSVPWPGSTFIIRSVASGDVLTLRDGKIILARPGSFGSIHWACVETKGWFGFRDPVSSRFLGHGSKGRLCCAAERHQGWENFCVRLTPEGGYVLLMSHYERLWHVGTIVEQGVEKLAKIGEKMSDAIVWEFVKV